MPNRRFAILTPIHKDDVKPMLCGAVAGAALAALVVLVFSITV